MLVILVSMTQNSEIPGSRLEYSCNDMVSPLPTFSNDSVETTSMGSFSVPFISFKNAVKIDTRVCCWMTISVGTRPLLMKLKGHAEFMHICHCKMEHFLMIQFKGIFWQTEEGAANLKASLILRPWNTIYSWTHGQVIPRNLCHVHTLLHRKISKVDVCKPLKCFWNSGKP